MNPGLLKKAEKDYPAGTKFISMYTFKEYTSTGRFDMFYDDEVSVYVKEGRFTISVFENGRWAKVTEKAKLRKK